MSRTQATRPRPHRPTKIDWAQAYASFVADPTLGFAGIARRFGVSEVAVRKHAKGEDWVARATTARAAVQAKLEADAVKTLEESNTATLLAVDEARERFREEIRNGRQVVNGRDLAALVRVEQLIRGEATDRVSVPEVRAFVQRLAVGLDTLLTGLVGEYVANGKRARLVAAFRAELGPVFEDAVAAAGMQLEPAATTEGGQ